jgi:hypothetical protein
LANQNFPGNGIRPSLPCRHDQPASVAGGGDGLGGFAGYLSDPDGYLWEVAWGAFEFNDDGSLKVD